MILMTMPAAMALMIVMVSMRRPANRIVAQLCRAEKDAE
jgi:hypothetical protein